MSKPITLHRFEVRAAKEGRLAQIRRPVVLHRYPNMITSVTNKGEGVVRVGVVDGVSHVSSPILFPGSILWARETFHICKDGSVYYQEEHGKGCVAKILSIDPFLSVAFKWRSPVTMPRWASRFDIRVKDVRVERLQEMTEEDAVKCGITDGMIFGSRYPTTTHLFMREWDYRYAKRGYGLDSDLWTWVADIKTEVKK